MTWIRVLLYSWMLKHPEYNLATLGLRNSSIFTDNTCELCHPRKTNNTGRVESVHVHLVQHPKKMLQKSSVRWTKDTLHSNESSASCYQLKRKESQKQNKWKEANPTTKKMGDSEVSCTQFAVNGVELLKGPAWSSEEQWQDCCLKRLRTFGQKKSTITDETSAGRGTRGPLSCPVVLCWESSVFAAPPVC